MNRVSFGLINRLTLTAEDMAKFIDEDLGLRIRDWPAIRQGAQDGDIYLATEFNHKHKPVPELIVEYTTNTSAKELLGNFEQKVSGTGGKVS